MAVPSYTHDLTDWIADADTTAWGEYTTMTSGGAPDEADTESALQGINSCSQITNATTLCSMGRVLGSPVTLTSGHVFLVWHGHGVATALSSYALGGLRLVVGGATLADWKAWSIGGVDVAPFPYAKWANNPIDPTLTAEYTNGTPPTGGTSISSVGSACLLTLPVARGQPHIVDIIRYGRAEARINGGETADYATFAGYAALNDAQTARWGLIQSTTGGYLWKGLMTLGYTSLVDFRDANKTIFVQDTRKVTSTFNKIEIRQAASRVDWTGISIVCTDPLTTASKGSLEVIDNADVNFSTCTFTDMDTFIFLANSTVLSSVFRRCGQVTVGGGTFSGCTFDSSTAASAVLAATPAHAALISSTDFISDGTGHGITVTGTAADFSLNADTFTGYAGTNGSTGNEAIYVNIATGSLTISITGGGSTPTIRTAGATVIVQNAVTVKVTVLDASTLAPIENARVLLEKVSDGTDILPPSSLTNASGIVTTSYAFTGDTAVTGTARRASAGLGTLYKPGAISGTITSGGFDVTILLNSDE